MFSKFELTNNGRDLLNRVIAEKKTLKFTKFQLGKGSFSGDKKTLTQLVSKFDEFNVSQTSVLADGITNIKGFYDNRNLNVASKLTEIGIMAQLGDDNLTEVLFSYSNQPSADAETVPSKENYFSRTFSVMNKTDNVTSVTFDLTVRQDKYNFGTLAEMKSADYLDVGDKVTLWGNSSLGDSSIKMYIITDQAQPIQLNNMLYAKEYFSIYDGVDSSSTTRAGSARAVKQANDNANARLSKTILIEDPEFDILSIKEPGFYKAPSDGDQANWKNKPYTSSISLGLIYQEQLGYRRSVIYIDQSGCIYTNTQINNASNSQWTGWNTIYSSKNKPTKSDVGLGNVANYEITDNVNDDSSNKYASAKAVKTVNDSVEKKQNKNDDELETSSKNIVGAINESLWTRRAKEVGSLTIQDDLNNYKTPGLYVSGGMNFLWANKPTYTNGAFALEVIDTQVSNGRGYVRQFLHTRDANRTFTRALLTGGTWTSWCEVLSEGSPAYYGLIGRGGKVTRIQDSGTKNAGDIYIDGDTGKPYRCLKTTTDTSVTSNFMISTLLEVAKDGKRIEQLFSGTVNPSTIKTWTKVCDIPYLDKYTSLYIKYTSHLGDYNKGRTDLFETTSIPVRAIISAGTYRAFGSKGLNEWEYIDIRINGTALEMYSDASSNAWNDNAILYVGGIY